MRSTFGALLLVAVVMPGAARAAANSNACIGTLPGPIVTLRGNFGHTAFKRNAWEAGTIFDARGARFESYLMPKSQAYKNCFPIQLNAPWGDCATRLDLYNNTTNAPAPIGQACVTGGVLIGTQPATAIWGNVKSAAGSSITISAENAIIEGMRVHNQEDAIVPMKSRNFAYRHNWVSYNRDDCIENDAFAGGTIDDNLFDGCYVFYSSTNSTIDHPPIAPEGGKSALVKITNNLIRMQNMPGIYKGTPDTMGYGHVFKSWDTRHSPGIELRNNIFLIEAPEHSGNPDVKLFSADLKRCSNNTIVWTGSGNYPGSYPTQCFTVTKDRGVWDRAKAAWIADHPDITRLPGDPG